MKLIKQKKINKQIVKPFSFSFHLEEDSLCLIEIVASAKSWWQNSKSSRPFSKDDDIFLYLDEQKLTTSLNTKKDTVAAWNGNELKGLEKTVLIAANLKKGNHTINLEPNQSPFINTITISSIEEVNKITYIPTANNPAQKGECRPWLSCIVLDLFITNFFITAKTNKNRRDDDDIKLLINGKVQKNESSKSHQDWYWCGKILKGGEKTFSQDVNTRMKQYNFDLYSDETPRLSRIEIGVNPPKTKIVPTVDNPKWTGDFNDDSEEMILARAIFGEGRSLPDEGRIAIAWSIRNRVEDKRWPDNYHGVILQKSQYSAFRKIDPNWEYVIDPFYKINSKQLAAWKRCYEIAGLVMSGKIKDPTGDVNHYFSDYIDHPSWTKSKNAKFIMKIGNTLFYNLEKNGSGGFIRIKYLIFALLVILISLGVYLAILWQPGYRGERQICEIKKELEKNINEPLAEPVDGLYDFYHYVYINPKKSEVERIFFNQNGQATNIKQLTNDGYYKYDLKMFSPDDSFRFGYFRNLHKNNEEFDESNDKQREEYYKNYVSLIINPGYGSTLTEVYRGDYHTSSWEWENIDHITVYNNCGTCCHYYYLININTKKIEEEGHLEAEEAACMMIN